MTAAKPGGDTDYPWYAKRPFGGEWIADLDDEWKNPRDGWEYTASYPYGRKHWAYSKENMRKFEAEGRIAYTRTGMPLYKRYLDEMKGRSLDNNWTDLPSARGTELRGYPTQKPVALLERIISASSNEGDVVLDPFCGCGTTIAAAQKLNREWIGIDITHLAVGLQKLRLKNSFGMLPVGEKQAALASSPKGTEKIAQGKAEGRNPGNESQTGSDPEGVEQTTMTDVAPLQGAKTTTNADPGFHPGLLSSSPTATGGTYRVIGQPTDLDGAKELADKDKYGFQWWILPLIGAKAFGSEAGKKEGKKGADKGVDGMMVFADDNSGKSKKVIVSVKGGHNVSVSHIRDLGHVIDRENAAIGVYVTLEPPTKPMIEEAAGKGFYHSPGWNKDYPRLQILTVEDILSGKQVNLPPNIDTFKQAQKIVAEADDQPSLLPE